MKRQNRTGIILGIIFAALLPLALGGCAGKQPAGAQPPEWVTKGSGAFKDAGSKVFYGVGAVTGVRNRPLAQTSSENRARAEIAKIFETYTASLMKDYAASTTGGGAVTGASATSEEQYIEQAIKTFSSATLNGVMIIDHWTDPSDGTLYSLARLDLDSFQNSLDKIKELNSAVRDYVKKNAEKSFDGLAAEEEKRGR
ncbi:MAG: LPP20 family lipoprotein [Nitrospirae bacterium]|nr:LPP20 family lipoprotein [Nitrospirota bacterium]